MFPYPIAKPQKCDIQTFYGVPSSTSKINTYMWNKPVGVSHVYMMLIGAGGNGNGTNGGGSGAVTVWYGAAQHIPNNLRVQCGSSEVGSEISMIDVSGSFVLLQASAGQSSTGATATSAPRFAASGFYKSVAGNPGEPADVSPASNTFLSAGSGAAGTLNTANYGYVNTLSGAGKTGFFMLQPIIVGTGGTGSGNGGIGCGSGGGGGGAVGGPGMVLIASW